jgi:hypothetical protein
MTSSMTAASANPPINMKVLAVAAVSLAAALALAPAGFAQPNSAQPKGETFSIEFNYDRNKSALENYAAFLRKAERQCTTNGRRTLAQIQHDRACVEATMDKLVDAMGRTDLALAHFAHTGRRADSSRSLAAR